jgi:SAM-dependent methyltransferase
MAPAACRLCGNSHHSQLHTAPESRYRSGEAFDYVDCAACGSLSLVTLPPDPGAHYPADYSGFRPAAGGRRRGWLRRQRDRYVLWGRGVIGRLLLARYPEPAIRALAGTDPAARVLDVGAGGGALVTRLRALGFAHVLGVDPYTAATYPNGARVVQGTLDDITGTWDVIMFHHAFEHVPDPGATLRAAADRLAPDGTLLIRAPLVPCVAWRRYGVAWVQLDAPRHVFIPSLEGLTELARANGLGLLSVRHDSTAFQFWGSECVRQGFPLDDAAAARFSRAQRRRWARAARQLNARGQGDQAAFTFMRAPAE